MKAKLWEVQTTEMQRRSGVRSFGGAPEMQTLSASHCTHTAREQLNGGIAELEEEVAATSDSLIANHSYPQPPPSQLHFETVGKK